MFLPTNASFDSSWPFAFWFVRCCARVVGDLECICLKVLRDPCWRLLTSPPGNSDGTRRRQLGWRVFHEPRINPQAHRKPLKHFTREYTGVSFIFPQGRR